jgi:hypothetical protein
MDRLEVLLVFPRQVVYSIEAVDTWGADLLGTSSLYLLHLHLPIIRPRTSKTVYQSPPTTTTTYVVLPVGIHLHKILNNTTQYIPGIVTYTRKPIQNSLPHYIARIMQRHNLIPIPLRIYPKTTLPQPLRIKIHNRGHLKPVLNPKPPVPNLGSP